MSAWDAALARLRVEFQRKLEQLPSLFFGWTSVASSSSVGDQDQVQTSDEATEDATGARRIGQRPTRRLEPWGFRGRPPGKVRSFWVRIGSSNLVTIGIAPGKGYGPTDLDEGESAQYCSKSGTIIRLDKDGKITITAAPGQDVVINGGTAKVGRVGDAVNGGTVTALAGVTPVNFIYTPVGGAPQPASPTLILSGGKITAGADHLKA